MQNKEILKNLYYGWIDESERKRERTERDEEEYKAYEALYATFTEEQKELFEEFYLCNCGVIAQLEEQAYVQGVKTGFWLAFELYDFSPRYDE